jgi:hydrogenase nickel incorporation protein HypA/HybF
MHELSAVEAMVETALDQADKVGSPRVVGMHFVINAGGHVTEESVQLCFDISAKGTPAEGAALFFEWNPPRYQCAHCGQVFEGRPSDEDLTPCVKCGQPAMLVFPSEEFYLDSIDVE